MKLIAKGLVQPGRIEVPQLELEAGECIVLCGPNGSGKSSLLRLLCGVDRPAQGRVELGGQALSRLSPNERAASIAWLPQRSLSHGAFRVESLVACARYRFFESQKVAEARSIELLERYKLGHLVGRLSTRISGGELQRVLIVSLVAQEASILMLDEPANHLDPQHQITTYQTLGQLWQAGKSVVIVSHDVRLAQLLGPVDRVRVVGIKNAQIQFSSRLSDPKLHLSLGQLYETRFVPPHQPGTLATDLEALVADAASAAYPPEPRR